MQDLQSGYIKFIIAKTKKKRLYKSRVDFGIYLGKY